jgi:hypothetical protein
MRTPSLICSLVLAASPMTASAATVGQTTFGAGLHTCSWFAQQAAYGQGFAQNDNTRGVLFWSLGYLSGLSRVSADQSLPFMDVSKSSGDEVWAGIVAGCRRDPLAPLVAVVESFWVAHRDK